MTLRAVGPVLSNSMFMVLPFITQRRSCPGHKHTEISSCALSTANWCLGTIPLVGIQLCAGRPEEQGQFQPLLLFPFPFFCSQQFYCATVKTGIKMAINCKVHFNRKKTDKLVTSCAFLCKFTYSLFINCWHCLQRNVTEIIIS